MRFCVIGPVYPYRGGIAHFTTMLARAMHERKHEVLVVSFKRQYPRWLYPGETDKDPSQNPLKVRDAQYWLDSLNPLSWISTFFRIRRNCPDVIVMQWWTPFWAPAWFVLGALTRFLLRIPIVYYCHNVLPHETRRWDAWIAKATLSWASLFLVQSAQEKRQLQVLLPRAVMQVTPLPTFDMFCDLRISKEEARQRLELPDEALVLLFFGFVRPYKGLNYLIEALPLVLEKQDVHLLIAGEFWDGVQTYLDLIRSLNLRSHVTLVDRYVPNEEVGVYFTAADLVVLPYVEATQSGIVQMALGFGVPVLTTTVGGLGEAVRDGITGLLVHPEDSQALALAIRRYFQEQLGPGMRANIQADSDRFAWAKIVSLMEQLDV